MEQLWLLVVCALAAFNAVNGAATTPATGCGTLPADIYFLLDSSGSVGSANFQKQKDFVARFAQAFDIGPNNVQIGVTTFSTSVHHQFYMNAHPDKASLIKAINAIPYQSGSTYTDKAIKYVAANAFTKPHGDRDHVVNILITMTDGQSNNHAATVTESTNLHKLPIESFAIGIGSGIRRDELNSIATDAHKVFTVSNFNALDSIQAELKKTACEVPGGWSKWGFWSPCTATCAGGTHFRERSCNNPPPANGGADCVGPAKQTHSCNTAACPTTPPPTTPATTPKPTTNAPGCGVAPADIVFILDSSGSVGTSNFQKMKNFVKTMVNGFDIGPTHTKVGVVTFSDKPHMEFHLNTHSSQGSIDTAIDGIHYISGGTNTADAIKYARQTSFLNANGARNNAAKVAIIITDGKSNNNAATSSEAQLLRNMGVTVFSIGVGTAKVSELNQMATDPDNQHVFVVNNFDALTQIKGELSQKACEVKATTAPPKNDTDCGAKADIVFLLDSSGSVGSANFQKMLKFVQDVSKNFKIGPNDVQIGVDTFQTSHKAEFNMNKYHDKTALLAAIPKITYHGGTTHTGEAIQFLHGTSFSAAAGNRPNVPDIGIVVTDGNSNNRNLTLAEAAKARQDGIKMLAIGVGHGINDAELKGIASNPDSQYVFRADNFDALQSLKATMSSKACEEAHNKPPENCTSTAQADIVFVLDSSGSVGKPNYDKMLGFVKSVVQSFPIAQDKVRVGMEIFSSRPYQIFNLNKYSDQASLSNAIDHVPYKSGGTNTGSALQTLYTKMFTNPNGDRPNVPNIAIVVTDGRSNNHATTVTQAKNARNHQIEVFSVGVGGNVAKSELNDIASDPDSTHVMTVSDFSKLQQIKAMFTQRTCVAINQTAPSRSSATPPLIDPCQDKLANCPSYNAGACTGLYTSWAKENCPRYCGYCATAIPTTPAPCVDKLSNCRDYEPTACQSFGPWAHDNCRKFCGFCGTNSAGIQGYNGKCSYNGHVYGQGEQWTDGCAYDCVCDDATKGHYSCYNRCPSYYNLPPQCTLAQKPGECCLQPVCNFNPTYQTTTGQNVGNLNGINVCVYKGKQYYQSTTWSDGCDFECECVDAGAGMYSCQSTCPQYTNLPAECPLVQQAGKCCAEPQCNFQTQYATFTGIGSVSGKGVGVVPTNPPPCVDKLTNCNLYQQDMCSNANYKDWALANCPQHCNLCPMLTQPGPNEVCVYQGKLYQQGQTWYDGCDYECLCENAKYGYYRCNNRCPSYVNLPAGCQTEKAAGECCERVRCTGSQGQGTFIGSSTITGSAGNIPVPALPFGATYAPGIMPTYGPGLTYAPGMIPTPAPGKLFAPNMIPTPAPGLTYAPGQMPTLAPGLTYAPNMIYHPIPHMTYAPGIVPSYAPGKTYAPGMIPTPAPGLLYNPYKIPTPAPGMTYAPGQAPSLLPGQTFAPGSIYNPTPQPTYAPNVYPTYAPGKTYAPGMIPTPAPGKLYAPNMIPTPAPGQTYAPGQAPTLAPGQTYAPGVFYYPNQTYAPNILVTYAPGKTYAPGMIPTPAPGKLFVPNMIPTPAPGQTYAPGLFPTLAPGQTYPPQMIYSPGPTYAPGVVPTYAPGKTYAPGMIPTPAPGKLFVPNMIPTPAPGQTYAQGLFPTLAPGQTYAPNMIYTPPVTYAPGLVPTYAPGKTYAPNLIPTPAPGKLFVPNKIPTPAPGQTYAPGLFPTLAPGKTYAPNIIYTPPATYAPGLVPTYAPGKIYAPNLIPTPAPGKLFVPNMIPTPAPGQTYAPGQFPTLAPGYTYAPNMIYTPPATYAPGIIPTYAPGKTYAPNMIPTPAPGKLFVPNMIPTPAPGQTYAPGRFPTLAPGRTYAPNMIYTQPATYAPGVVPTYAPGKTFAPNIIPTPAPGQLFVPNMIPTPAQGSTYAPGMFPTLAPGQTYAPNMIYTQPATYAPGLVPTYAPGKTYAPNMIPTPAPGKLFAPNKIPTPAPGRTYAPGQFPTLAPGQTYAPNMIYTPPATYSPGHIPTYAPAKTYAPNLIPTPAPGQLFVPNMIPTPAPGQTYAPGQFPTLAPGQTYAPHMIYTPQVTYAPGLVPTYAPGKTYAPNMIPTPAPGKLFVPNKIPTPAPGQTYAPGLFPTLAPGQTYAPNMIYTPPATYAPGLVPTYAPGKTYAPNLIPTPAPGKLFAPNMIPTPAPGQTYAPGLFPTLSPGQTYAPNMIYTPQVTYAPGIVPTYAPGKTYAPNLIPTPAPGKLFVPNMIPTPAPGQTYAPGQFPTLAPGQTYAPNMIYTPPATYAPGLVPTYAPAKTYAPNMIPTPAPGQLFVPNMIPTPAPGQTYAPGQFPTLAPGQTYAPNIVYTQPATYAPGLVPTYAPGRTYAPGLIPTPAPGQLFVPNKIPTPAPYQTYAPGMMPTLAPGQTYAPNMIYSPTPQPQILVPTAAPNQISGRVDGCYVNGSLFQQGQRWQSGCDFNCLCEDAKTGRYRCSPKCPQFNNLPSTCTMQDNPDDPCCQRPVCTAGPNGQIAVAVPSYNPGFSGYGTATNPAVTGTLPGGVSGSGGSTFTGTGSGGTSVSGGRSGCVYKSHFYKQGETWDDGCTLRCTCEDATTGRYRCSDRCQTIQNLPPQCRLVTDPNDSCCKTYRCDVAAQTTPQPFYSHTRPASGGDFCVFKGSYYKQGEEWTDACQYKCRCEDARNKYYQCTPRCAHFDNIPLGCTFVQDPKDPTCCKVPRCSVTGNVGPGTIGSSSGGSVPTGYTGTFTGSARPQPGTANYNPNITLTGYANACIYKGQIYQQGATWHDGCEYDCECTNAQQGQYRCTDRCARYGAMSSNCHLGPDPNDQCCQKPACTPTGPTTCADRLSDCAQYGDYACKAPYDGWAKDNCAKRCGLCPGQVAATSTTPTQCVNKLSNCDRYGKNSCSGQFLGWARENCPVYCNLCGTTGTGSGTGTGTGTGTGSGTGTGTGTVGGTSGVCADALPNCAEYTQASCVDPYVNWATQNCAKFCGLCGGTGSGVVTGTGGGISGTGTGTGTQGGFTGVGIVTQKPGQITGTSNGCFYKNQLHQQGDNWQDGCEYNCTCSNAATGYYVCNDLCPTWTNLPQGCNLIKNPGECCAKPSCLSGTGTGTGGTSTGTGTGSSGTFTGVVNGCVYKGTTYSQGQTWDDACTYKCTCADASQGYYTCNNKCVTWNLPSVCHLNNPAAGKCCKTPSCPTGYLINYPAGYTEE